MIHFSKGNRIRQTLKDSLEFKQGLRAKVKVQDTGSKFSMHANQLQTIHTMPCMADLALDSTA
ncbi:MAG TPA: hypothetical protein DHV39_00720 [Verrucomicrobiales bacterium]|nr:hypothetical protein [Verrucomicrobiales bacterium]HCZ01923.1 hypothetical protein [Verrucomicrobiales bacterium]